MDRLILGTSRSKRLGLRMEMVNVKVFDQSDVAVGPLFGEGPQVHSVRNAHLWDIREAIARLHEDIRSLRQSLKIMPEQDHALSFDAYGYHSSYMPVLDELPTQPRWTIDFKTKSLEGLYLIPAIDRRDMHNSGYGFPKRFRVVGRDEHGQRQVLSDWTDADSPNPGSKPVRIHVDRGHYQQLSVDIFKGCEESGQEYFALGELIARAGYR